MSSESTQKKVRAIFVRHPDPSCCEKLLAAVQPTGVETYAAETLYDALAEILLCREQKGICAFVFGIDQLCEDMIRFLDMSMNKAGILVFCIAGRDRHIPGTLLNRIGHGVFFLDSPQALKPHFDRLREMGKASTETLPRQTGRPQQRRAVQDKQITLSKDELDALLGK